MDKLEKQYLGHFTIEGRKRPGRVMLDNAASLLEVYADDFFHLPEEKMRKIYGVAQSGEKITICDAVGSGVPSTHQYHGATKHSLSLFPNYIAIGPRHLDPDKKIVASVSFTTSGATDLHYDLGAFGMAVRERTKNVKQMMPSWARKDPRKIQFSNVYYYVDRGPIVSVETASICIQAFNAPSMSFPSPRGIKVKNEVRISIKFKKPVTLEEGLRSIYQYTSFSEIVSQSKQCVRQIRIDHKSAKETEFGILLYNPNADTEETPSTDFRDHLVSGGLNKKEFETVLRKWMERQNDFGNARRRISGCVREDMNYGVDRLLGAANAFDLLPSEAVGKPNLPQPVTKKLNRFAEEAKELKEPYREMVLNSLHLAKSSNLRQKITARFKRFPAALQRRFPDIEFVIDHAIRTRNHFVHGTKPKLTITDTYHFIPYFTDSLEFIFVAADLSECGWKSSRWLKTASHGRLRWHVRSYEQQLEKLKKASGSS